MKFSKKMISLALSISMVAGVVSLTGCSKNYMDADTAKDTLAVTIGDEKIYMDKIKPAIFVTEVTTEVGNNLMYQSYGITYSNIWDLEVDADKGLTGAEKYRDDTMNSFCENYILSKEAVAKDKKKYAISEDDSKRLKENADKLMDAMSESIKEKTGFTSEDFIDYQNMVYIANKYKEQVIKDFKVTKKDVEADYDYDNQYREYKTNYVRFAIATTDESGNQTPVADDVKAKAKKTMDTVLKELKGGSNIDDVCAKHEGVEAAKEPKTYTQADAYPEKVPVKKDDTDKDSKDKNDDKDKTEEKVEPTTDAYYLGTRELKNNEYSDVIEYDGYYYIAMMVDNNSKEAYDSAIESGISTKEGEKYDAYYEELKKKDNYKITINEDVWNDLKFGELTVNEDELAKYFKRLKKPGIFAEDEKK